MFPLLWYSHFNINFMNTYSKYVPNVFLAKCEEIHERDEIITMTTKYGQEHEVIVFNLIYQKDRFYYYSIIRADGFNAQERAKAKAARLNGAANNAESKSNQFWEKSHEGKDFLSLSEPIKVGHHSEHRHRALIERNNNRMSKAMELKDVAATYEQRAKYWESKANDINLSMPESLEYYEFELERAKAKHQMYKDFPEKRTHSFSLTYAKKEVNELESKLQTAIKLWQ